MGDKWREMIFEDAVNVNPPRKILRGEVAPHVSMDIVQPFTRTINYFEMKEFKGSGSRFQNGDTLLARITPCLENGKTAFISCLPDDTVGHGSTEFIVLSGKEGISDNLFVYYLSVEPAFRNYAIQQMEGSTGRQRVPAKALTKLSIDLPSLPEQKAIASILGALDDKIELNRKMNETLEAMARAIFKSWFVDFDPIPSLGPHKEWQDSPLGKIPKGWRVGSLDGIADYLNGLALQKYPPENDYEFLPVIKIAQLRKDSTEGSDKASVNIDPSYVVSDGDILFSWSGSLEVVIWCGGRGALNQHLFKVTSKNYPKWFYYLWTKHYLPDFQAIAAGKATTMGHIQRHHLATAKMLIPPPNLLKAMDTIMSPLIENKIVNSVQSRTLAAIRDTLLPKLLSGEIRVKGN
jgi:type I restriction enzyme S subunit